LVEFRVCNCNDHFGSTEPVAKVLSDGVSRDQALGTFEPVGGGGQIAVFDRCRDQLQRGEYAAVHRRLARGLDDRFEREDRRRALTELAVGDGGGGGRPGLEGGPGGG